MDCGQHPRIPLLQTVTCQKRRNKKCCTPLIAWQSEDGKVLPPNEETPLPETLSHHEEIDR